MVGFEPTSSEGVAGAAQEGAKSHGQPHDGVHNNDFGHYDWLNPGGVTCSYSGWNNYYPYTYPNYYYSLPLVLSNVHIPDLLLHDTSGLFNLLLQSGRVQLLRPLVGNQCLWMDWRNLSLFPIVGLGTLPALSSGMNS